MLQRGSEDGKEKGKKKRLSIRSAAVDSARRPQKKIDRLPAHLLVHGFFAIVSSHLSNPFITQRRHQFSLFKKLCCLSG
jgi:hypothetical protein